MSISDWSSDVCSSDLGISISVSGIALLFPFELSMFGGTFKLMNLVGLYLPTDLTVQEEMQLSQLWHAVGGLLLIAVVIAHIYIGTIGMEGAFDAMGTGQVRWEEHTSELQSLMWQLVCLLRLEIKQNI